MPRALIYCRISSDPTGKAAGVQRQEEDCRALAETLGWDVVDVLVDNDISAYSRKPRPGYRRLLETLKAGAADAVIVWHPDRLYRRLRDLEELVDVVTASGATIRTVKAGEVDLSTPTGRAMARTAAVWAGHEVEHGIERMKSAKLQLLKSGRFTGGPRPFGFLADGVTHHPVEAEAIRDATRRVLAGESLRGIAREWQDRGIRTPRGGQSWDTTRTRKILTRARNAGLVEAHGEIIGPGEWEPIVPEHELMGVRAIIADPSRRLAASRDPVSLGSGLFLCGVCGATVRRSSRAGGAPKAYRCKAHDHLARVAYPVDEYVTAVVLEVLRRPEVRATMHASTDKQVSAWQSEAQAIRAELDGLAEALGRREITLRAHSIAAQRMTRDLQEVEARLRASAAHSPLSGIVDAPEVEQAWSAAPVDRRKAIVDTLMTVTLLPGARGPRFTPESVLIEPKSQ